MKIGDRVQWTDPDGGIASGPATIVAMQSDDDDAVISITKDSGGDAEVTRLELQLLLKFDIVVIEITAIRRRKTIEGLDANDATTIAESEDWRTWETDGEPDVRNEVDEVTEVN